jgi:hypothetical protein
MGIWSACASSTIWLKGHQPHRDQKARWRWENAMFSKQDQIQGYDDALLAAMNAEDQRQEDHIELIASENYTSQRVMQAQGSG